MNNAYRKYRTALANRFKRLKTRNYKSNDEYRIWSRTARQAHRLTTAEGGMLNKKSHVGSLAILAQKKNKRDVLKRASSGRMLRN